MPSTETTPLSKKVRELIDAQTKTMNGQLKNVTRRLEADTRSVEKWLTQGQWRKAVRDLQKQLRSHADALRTDAFHRAGLATLDDLAQLKRKLSSLHKNREN